MATEVSELEEYLRKTLHVPVRLRPWDEESALPNFLRRYRFLRGTIANTSVLLLFSEEALTASVATKHLRALHEKWSGPAAFVFGSITPRGRARLVQEGIPFVVPHYQVYLPMLGVSLAETYQRTVATVERLRPSAQLLLLLLLVPSAEARPQTPSAAAARLGYTAMAMGVALDQLAAAELVQVRKVGRTRRFKLAGDESDMWQRAQPFLTTPVTRRAFVTDKTPDMKEALTAGLSALAMYSMLDEPQIPIEAISKAQANALNVKGTGAHDIEDASAEIEVWSYDPKLLSKGPIVDRLSLFLSLRDDTDERVQLALEEMMREMNW